jgi:hypothetical protein
MQGAGTIAPVSVAGPAAAPAAAPGTASGTVVQEAGVDEPDLLQSDGSALYTLRSNGSAMRLQTWRRATDGSATRLKALDLPTDGAINVSGHGMVLSTDQHALAVVGEQWQPGGGVICIDICPAIATPGMVWGSSTVIVQRVDVSDPAAASVGERVAIDGRLVDSRRVGDNLVVVSTHVPVLPVDVLPATATAAEREATIASLAAADVLPRVRRNGGASQALLAETDCWVQPANASTAVQITTITVFDLRAPTLAPRSRCFVGGTEALYMTTENLYLATTRWSYVPASGGVATLLAYPADFKTDVHKFALSSGDLVYRATGEVTGHLGWNTEMKSYRFSEWNGDLRVITFTGTIGWATPADAAGSTPPSPALLTVLRERASDQTLQPLATLPNSRRPELLGKVGEQLHAVRFDGARGYLVTFRTIDPLYVLDLQDPADPKIVGALEVPGFSDQLFPLDGGLLLGVGRDTTPAGRIGGVKVGLFDVSDPTNPKPLQSVTLGAGGSLSALDYTRHGLNWMMQGNVARISLPVSLTQSDYASPWQRGLQRFEVDTAARTLRTLSMVGNETGHFYIAGDRSLQIGGQVYYLRDGELTGYDW